MFNYARLCLEWRRRFLRKLVHKHPFVVYYSFPNNLFWTLSIAYMSDTDKAWPGLTSWSWIPTIEVWRQKSFSGHSSIKVTLARFGLDIAFNVIVYCCLITRVFIIPKNVLSTTNPSFLDIFIIYIPVPVSIIAIHRKLNLMGRV